MPSKTAPSEPLPMNMKGNKIDELMKWLRLVLKHTKFSRLLPVLSECLTMEQIDMLISAKAAMILERQENIKKDEKNDKIVKEEKIKIFQTFSFDGESGNEVHEEEATNSGDEVRKFDNNEQSNYSDEFDDHMKLESEEEDEARTSNDEVRNDDINAQTNKVDETPNPLVRVKLRATRKPKQSALTKRKKMGRPRNWTSLECRECDMVFDTYCKKKYHMSSIHSTRTFQCSVCQQHFSSSTSLKRHGLVHQDFAEFSCKVCNKSVKRKTALAEHMRTHTGEKPFPCPHCPYRGSSSSLLAHHKKNKHTRRGGIKMLL